MKMRMKTNKKKDKKIFQNTSSKHNVKNQSLMLQRGGRYL